MKNTIINYIRARYPGLYLASPEEQRVAVISCFEWEQQHLNR